MNITMKIAGTYGGPAVVSIVKISRKARVRKLTGTKLHFVSFVPKTCSSGFMTVSVITL